MSSRPTKRGAGSDLNRDRDEDSSDSNHEEGQQAPEIASKEVLAQRVIVKAKRKGADELAKSTESVKAAMPTFNFAAPPAEEKPAAVAEPAKPAEAEKPVETPKPAAAFNPFAKFAPPPGSWECRACEVNNKAEATQCKACETPKPAEKGKEEKSENNKEEPKKETNGASSFGGFSFGGPTGSSGGFQFSWPTASSTGAPATTGGFSFGAPATGFTFGAVDSSSNGGFTFGSAAVGEGATSFGAVGGEGFEGGDEDPSAFAPTAALAHASQSHLFKEAVKEVSGEEGDTIRLQIHTKAFVLKSVPEPTSGENEEEENTKPGKPKWVELGVGELHINTYTSTGGKLKGRFILRAEKTQRLLINSPLFKGLLYNVQNENLVKFHSFNEQGEKAAYLLKFKTKAEAEDLMAGIKSTMELL